MVGMSGHSKMPDNSMSVLGNFFRPPLFFLALSSALAATLACGHGAVVLACAMFFTLFV